MARVKTSDGYDGVLIQVITKMTGEVVGIITTPWRRFVEVPLADLEFLSWCD